MLIATSMGMTTNTLLPIQRTRGGMTLNSSTHVGLLLNLAIKGKKMKDTSELRICVFPVDMPSSNTDVIAVIKLKKDRVVVLMCVESHYTE